MSVYGAQQTDSPRFDDTAQSYDAVLIMSFGGPEGMEDVIPFLENVTRGRNIPRARLEEVAEHYYHFNGVSPINAQNRALIAALQTELQAHGIDLPIYFGNRNWHPLITDTIRQMQADGVKRAIAFFTSAFSSYSGCRQYRENIIAACEGIENPPTIDKLRVFYNHPGFIQPMAENVRVSLAQLPAPERAIVVFTAHSIPLAMARGSAYEAQLQEACRLVAESIGLAPERYRLVYQSRSGAPHIPWLEPDILDTLDQLHAENVDQVVIAPIGFISDHMEVLYDLETEAVEKAAELGITLIRAPTVGTDPTFIAMIRALIVERMSDNPVRLALGSRGPNHDICPLNCCRPG
ncbi:MAG: ferrochelatase [Anaerolineae bacterium]|jgi:ferrochelatase|nr:ferrochelatase [Anaerolineae bacterium]